MRPGWTRARCAASASASTGRAGIPARRAAAAFAPTATTRRPYTVSRGAMWPAAATSTASAAGTGTPATQPRPSAAKPLPIGTGMQWPSVNSSAAPRSTDRPASVTMEAGMRCQAMNQPCTAPTSPPASNNPAATSGQGNPARSPMAESALASATVEPTERSVPPVVTTKVMATATTSKGADWRSRLSRSPDVGNAGAASAKPVQHSSRAPTTPSLARPPMAERTWSRNTRPSIAPASALSTPTCAFCGPGGRMASTATTGMPAAAAACTAGTMPFTSMATTTRPCTFCWM